MILIQTIPILNQANDDSNEQSNESSNGQPTDQSTDNMGTHIFHNLSSLSPNDVVAVTIQDADGNNVTDRQSRELSGFLVNHVLRNLARSGRIN